MTCIFTCSCAQRIQNFYFSPLVWLKMPRLFAIVPSFGAGTAYPHCLMSTGTRFCIVLHVLYVWISAFVWIYVAKIGHASYIQKELMYVSVNGLNIFICTYSSFFIPVSFISFVLFIIIIYCVHRHRCVGAVSRWVECKERGVSMMRACLRPSTWPIQTTSRPSS